MDIWGEVGRATVLHCWSEKVLGRRESLGKELRRKRSEPSLILGKTILSTKTEAKRKMEVREEDE